MSDNVLENGKVIPNELDNKAVTPIDLFEQFYNLKMLTIKVQCPNCGHAWGIRISDYDLSIHIPKRKFICTECGM